jgi:hypothetical protein
MDELEMRRQKAEHELALTPVIIEIPDVCCVRICDREAKVLDYGDETGRLTHRPGATLLIYAFCPEHADTETR